MYTKHLPFVPQGLQLLAYANSRTMEDTNQ